MQAQFQSVRFTLNKAIRQAWKVKSYRFINEARPDYGLLYLETGRIDYRFGGNILTLKPGDVVYLPKGSYYEAHFDVDRGPVDDYLMSFDAPEAPFPDLAQPALILCDPGGVLIDHFRLAAEGWSDKEKSFLAQARFFLCLSALQTMLCARGRGEEYLLFENAAKQLAENAGTAVDALAASLHMSRSGFQKKFKEYFGAPPAEYRAIQRMERAKLLLQTTDMPIKEIADHIGFYDVAHFCKAFEKRCGYTPKRYRTAFKASF